MRYKDCLESIVRQFQHSNKRVPALLGPPGVGKSACALDVGPALNIPKERTILFHASTQDSTDISGLPQMGGDYVAWKPQEIFHRLGRGTGPGLLILDEVFDVNVQMQNALCGVVYDRQAGQFKLSEELFIICTGNRVSDKSGAQRVTTKFANRLSLLEFEYNHDDWVEWALKAGIDGVLIQFLRFRPALLHDFSTERFANPTPRSWARVAEIPTDLRSDVFFEHVKGEVSEGPATEYLSFRKIYESLPDIDMILANPKKADVPKDPATLFALSGALARRVKVPTMDNMVEYLQRIPAEFSMVCIKDAVQLDPNLAATKGFGQWAMNNHQILV